MHNENNSPGTDNPFRFTVPTSNPRQYGPSSDTLLEIEEAGIPSSPTIFADRSDVVSAQSLAYIPEEQALRLAKDVKQLDGTTPSALETLDRHDSSRRFYQPRAIRAFSQNPQELLASHNSCSDEAAASTSSEELLTHTHHHWLFPHEFYRREEELDPAVFDDTITSEQTHSFSWLTAPANLDTANESSYSESTLQQAVAFNTPGPSFRPHKTVTPLPWSIAQEGWRNSDMDDVPIEGQFVQRLNGPQHSDSYAIAEDSYVMAERSLGPPLSSTWKDYHDVTPYTFDPSFERTALTSINRFEQAQDSHNDTRSFHAKSGCMEDTFEVRYLASLNN